MTPLDGPVLAFVWTLFVATALVWLLFCVVEARRVGRQQAAYRRRLGLVAMPRRTRRSRRRWARW